MHVCETIALMNNEILQYYFTDNQLAAIKGITLGGLRNKIYRSKDSGLPPYISVNTRTRLWSKEVVREHLMTEYQGDVNVVDGLIAMGEKIHHKAPAAIPK